MMYLITIHGILSMIVLYIILQYTDHNEELHYKEVEIVEMKKEVRVSTAAMQLLCPLIFAFQ